MIAAFCCARHLAQQNAVFAPARLPMAIFGDADQQLSIYA
jgi:hypothetical protein